MIETPPIMVEEEEEAPVTGAFGKTLLLVGILGVSIMGGIAIAAAASGRRE
jgi:hypothetical protein